MRRGYGQFCPVAKAAEVIGDRWSLLVLREMLYGNRHFNDISRGVPLMSRALLVQRLKELEKAGVVMSHEKDTGKGYEYLLTPAGEALRPIIEAMGVWAQQWGSEQIASEDLDDALLMWGMRRRINLEAIPVQKIVLQLDFRGLTRGRKTQRSWWLMIEDSEVDVCQKDPGFEVDVLISADLSAFSHVWMGFTPLNLALEQGSISFEGDRNFIRQIPTWLYLNGEWRYGMGLDHSATQLIQANKRVAAECSQGFGA
ncbi:transcriptional regulator [Synechococcales cyanobacterium C]|uniref:Transcriptional regulator n=1 Tax=Petrachloros mirabilis ULC683 TaxID=2781853 RepID=A0A8K1ZZ88_9CYAN|nr:helix-turn-helix domain-containing protein [Petrachloros mirabilis]NCJ07889.1 transcriptional regulator [Petrachloros mirabilis ULC683]